MSLAIEQAVLVVEKTESAATEQAVSVVIEQAMLL